MLVDLLTVSTRTNSCGIHVASVTFMLAVMFCRNSNHASSLTFSAWASENSRHPGLLVQPWTSDISLPVVLYKSTAWLLMWKLGAECRFKFLLQFACLVYRFLWPHIDTTLIFFCKNLTNAGKRTHVCDDEHHSFINPFMNHVLHLGRRLAFCCFSSVCALFIASVLVEAVQNEDLNGWSFYLWEWDQCLRFPPLIARLMLLTKGSPALLEWVS